MFIHSWESTHVGREGGSNHISIKDYVLHKDYVAHSNVSIYSLLLVIFLFVFICPFFLLFGRYLFTFKVFVHLSLIPNLPSKCNEIQGNKNYLRESLKSR